MQLNRNKTTNHHVFFLPLHLILLPNSLHGGKNCSRKIPFDILFEPLAWPKSCRELDITHRTFLLVLFSVLCVPPCCETNYEECPSGQGQTDPLLSSAPINFYLAGGILVDTWERCYVAMLSEDIWFMERIGTKCVGLMGVKIVNCNWESILCRLLSIDVPIILRSVNWEEFITNWCWTPINFKRTRLKYVR